MEYKKVDRVEESALKYCGHVRINARIVKKIWQSKLRINILRKKQRCEYFNSLKDFEAVGNRDWANKLVYNRAT